MATLRGFAAAIRARHGATPDFDPADGGPAAEFLLLLETPGPTIGGTGFVSADNPTGTARNIRRFLADAGIGRSRLVIWNTVPWVIHAGGPNRAPRRAEVAAGLAELPALLPLLPHLRGVVLAGRNAALAQALVAPHPSVQIPHPSPTYVCTSPDVARRIAAGLAQAAGWPARLYTGPGGK